MTQSSAELVTMRPPLGVGMLGVQGLGHFIRECPEHPEFHPAAVETEPVVTAPGPVEKLVFLR